jgi:hypothetical protein
MALLITTISRLSSGGKGRARKKVLKVNVNSPTKGNEKGELRAPRDGAGQKKPLREVKPSRVVVWVTASCRLP